MSQLVQELLAFRVKIDPLTSHDSYGAEWRRDGTNDDMVLAVAIAAWWGQRGSETDNGPYGIIKARM